MSNTDVTVVIVNWNAADVLGPCIDSILRQQYPGEVSIVVVDNASSDHSLELLADYKHPVKVLALRENLGFGKGNNVGFGEVNTHFTIFLNPDTELLTADVLTKLVAPLRNPDVGLVGPHLVNPDGSTQQSCALVPSLVNLIFSGLGLPRMLPDRLRRRVAPVIWSHDTSTRTGWLRGACLAMRSSDFAAVGRFSERTFMYGEDLELAYAVRKHGMAVWYERNVDVLHHDDHSSAKRWSDTEKMARVAQGEVAFLQVRYPAGRAAVAQMVLWASYAGRSAILRRIGRQRAASIYGAMAHAIQPAVAA